MFHRHLLCCLVLLSVFLAAGCGNVWLTPLQPDKLPPLPEGQTTSWGRIRAETANCRDRYIGQPYNSMLVQAGNGPFYNTTREGDPPTRSYYYYYWVGFPGFGFVELKIVEYRLTLDDEGIVQLCEAYATNIKKNLLDGHLQKDLNYTPPLADDTGPWALRSTAKPPAPAPDSAAPDSPESGQNQD